MLVRFVCDIASPMRIRCAQSCSWCILANRLKNRRDMYPGKKRRYSRLEMLVCLLIDLERNACAAPAVLIDASRPALRVLHKPLWPEAMCFVQEPSVWADLRYTKRLRRKNKPVLSGTKRHINLGSTGISHLCLTETTIKAYYAVLLRLEQSRSSRRTGRNGCRRV